MRPFWAALAAAALLCGCASGGPCADCVVQAKSHRPAGIQTIPIYSPSLKVVQIITVPHAERHWLRLDCVDAAGRQKTILVDVDADLWSSKKIGDPYP